MSNLAGRGQITIGNTVGTCECIISSSRGNLFVKTGENDNGITLTATIVNNTGIIDDLDSSLFYYLWKKNNDEWRPNQNNNNSGQGTRTINLLDEDLIISSEEEAELGGKNLVFSCEVYFRKENYNYLESDLITYGEINLETTLKYWMEFNDNRGLIIRKEGDNLYTLTNNTGFFILEENNNSIITRGAFSIYDNFFSSVSIGKYSLYEKNGGLIFSSPKLMEIGDLSGCNLNTLYLNAAGKED